MLKILMYKNGFMKKNIVRFFFITVLAIAFCGCKKDFTRVQECRIVGGSVIKTDSTNAVLQIEVALSSIYNWSFDVGVGMWVNWDELTYSIYRDYENPSPYHVYIATIGGLQSGTTYFWKPFIEADTIMVWGETYHFTTEME